MKYFWIVIFYFLVLSNTQAQYEDNPLKNKRWFTVSGGISSKDYISWQGMGSYSMRGESFVTQFRAGYSQELIESPHDSCTSKKNRLSEIGILWGDGWGGRKWYVTGSVGFALDVVSYCSHGSYTDRYLTAISPGIAAQAEAGYFISNRLALCIVTTANYNYRTPYVGGNIGITYRIAAKKLTITKSAD